MIAIDYVIVFEFTISGMLPSGVKYWSQVGRHVTRLTAMYQISLYIFRSCKDM
jgi:hypothetical protein